MSRLIRHLGRGSFLLAITALLFCGCPGSSSSPPPNGTAKTKQPLTLLVIDDPQLGKAIARQWRSDMEQDVKVVDLSAAEAIKAGRLPGDAVVFPTGMIGQFAEKGLILPLEDDALEDSAFDYRDVFAPLRLHEMRWGNRTVAVTLGSPRLLLAYRSDIFEEFELALPADWDDYQKLVETLADRQLLGELAPPADQPWHATVEPLAEGWAGQLLLARAAAYALHRDQVSPLLKFDSLEPLIAEPAYRRALEELIAAAKSGGFAEQALTPDQAWRELREGRVAMALTWPSATPGAETKSDAREAKIGFALLPGSPVAYNFATKSWDRRATDDPSRVPLLAMSGRLASVTSSSSDPARAAGFLVWLAGREASGQLAAHSSATTLYRLSQAANPVRWTASLPPNSARQYADALTQTMELPRAFPGMRLPGHADYLQALDKVVAQAIAGKKSPEEALTEAADAWRAINEKLGVKEQLRANARSLGQQSL
jgi:ABC-type glycerol-3-phosphate transport system substrate-binding protein